MFFLGLWWFFIGRVQFTVPYAFAGSEPLITEVATILKTDNDGNEEIVGIVGFDFNIDISSPMLDKSQVQTRNFVVSKEGYVIFMNGVDIEQLEGESALHITQIALGPKASEQQIQDFEKLVLPRINSTANFSYMVEFNTSQGVEE
jgi:hypothetical protein